jgi:acetyl-CoA carboxylase biotin carboxyl carrier protein
LTELEYQEGDKKIKVSKWTPPSVEKISTNVKSNTTKAVLNDGENGTRIKSPIIGTAYLSPEPGAKQFIKVGDKIKKGQTIMIVEAMKTMNHIPSTNDGEVKEILIKDEQPVEFGQTLVLLK